MPKPLGQFGHRTCRKWWNTIEYLHWVLSTTLMAFWARNMELNKQTSCIFQQSQNVQPKEMWILTHNTDPSLKTRISPANNGNSNMIYLLDWFNDGYYPSKLQVCKPRLNGTGIPNPITETWDEFPQPATCNWTITLSRHMFLLDVSMWNPYPL